MSCAGAWTARLVGIALGSIALPLLPMTLLAQRGSLSGVIVSNASKEPLAYAIVALPDLGRQQFTSDSGAFIFADLPLGPVTLTVRRLGYAPVDVTIPVAQGVQPVRIELTRVAVRLGSVTVRAYPLCTTPGPPAPDADSAMAALFSQLRMNAEQLRFLSTEYPFVTRMDVVRAHKGRKGKLEAETRTIISVESRRQWRYRPGAVVTHSARDYIFNIPTLIQLADERFLAEHCFHYAGIDTVDDLPLARLDVVAAERIKAPDVNGSLFLDPDNFQIRRSVLSLTRGPGLRALSSWVVTTDFHELMESVPIIARVYSAQTFDTTQSRSYDAVYEDWHLLDVKFVGKKPGG